MPNPGSPVRVESLNPATSNFEAVASTASGNVPTPEILGQRWYPWQATAPLESRFWVSGASGASATLRAVSQTGSQTDHLVSGRPDQIGLSAGSFVRIVYPRGNGAREMTGFDPNAIAAAMTSAGTPWRGAVALRVYDIGVCSSLVTWRTLMGRLQMTVGQVLMSNPQASGLRPWGRAVLTPVLRGDGPDAIGFTQRFSTAQIGATDVLVKFLIGLSLSGGQIASSADDVEVQIDGFPGAEGAHTAVENRLRMLIPPAVDQAARRATLGGTIPIRRVYSRPEGLEFVLADDIADPLFAGLNAAGFCSRPTPAGSMPILAHFGSIFDPRQPSDPVVFGDP